jgi:DNA-binding MarR family transcriptional regulator
MKNTTPHQNIYVYICNTGVMEPTSLPAQPIRELALALHELSWRMSRFGAAQVGIDPLPASELAVLRAVVANPGRSVSEVGAAVAMQSSNVSAGVRALIERGLVAKTADEHDRRVSLLYPTPQALADKRAIDDALAASMSSALETLPAEAVATLLTALPSLRDLVNAVAAVSVKRTTRLPASADIGTIA